MGSRPKDRAVKAMAAMKDIGFSTAKTKIVLKQLLKTFYNNWTHIESENYRLLVEALVESDVAEVEDRKGCKDSDDNLHSKKKEATPPDDPEPHRKKLREGKEGWPLTSVQNAGMSSKSTSLGQGSVAAVEEMSSDSDLPIEPCLDLVPIGAAPTHKFEQISGDSVPVGVPLAVVHPSLLGPTATEALDTELPSNDPEANCQRTFRDANLSLPELKGSSTAQVANEDNTRRNCSAGGYGTGAKEKLANVVESPSDAVEIVSSTTGGARLLLSCNVVDCPSFQMPDLQSVIKKVEDKCLRSYKILDPKFSLMNIMKELCDTLLEMGTESVEGKLEEHLARINPLLDPLKLICSGNLASGVSTCHATSSSGLRLPQDPEPMAMDGVEHLAQPILLGEGTIEEMSPSVPGISGSLVLYHQHEPALGDVRPVHDLHDITKGEERVRISVVNVVNTEEYPPHFSYIPHNIVYQNAQLTFSLARIADENCCPDCFGDCLSAPIPCACARETGGEYAYRMDGLLRTEFLADCISMKHEPKQHQLFYCKDCPLEKTQNEANPDPCKGHLLRKFIKECWSKCGCTKQCGNRVVQRGISCNLQVFFTSERKGWGLRAVDDLPKGAFVCEYVGEILTNMELYHRTLESTGNARHTYPVLLDADWGSEGLLGDEEALCLDATFYGNVARFINHRCGDASLLEIPVEVESPDHHYYHLALFTTRKVEAFEELTWDYGIDFDDENHPIKAFRCCCGSKFCRDGRQRKRTTSSAFILK